MTIYGTISDFRRRNINLSSEIYGPFWLFKRSAITFSDCRHDYLWYYSDFLRRDINLSPEIYGLFWLFRKSAVTYKDFMFNTGTKGKCKKGAVTTSSSASLIRICHRKQRLLYVCRRQKQEPDTYKKQKAGTIIRLKKRITGVRYV
jgi:hypothetical protein